MFPHLSSGARPNREGFDVNYSSKPQPALPANERTQYGYKNHEGHRLHIMADRILTGNVLVSITGIGDLEPRSMNIPDAEMPGVALAILRAAGVTSSPHDCADSLELALAQLEEHEGIRRNRAAQQELTRRRDELARNFADDAAFAYLFSNPSHQAAIDMIIQLQDEATK